jgi:hypothetical protein
VEHVATALLKYETLTGDEVRAMLAGATADTVRRPAAPVRPTAGPTLEPTGKLRPVRVDEEPEGGLAGGTLPVPDPA